MVSSKHAGVAIGQAAKTADLPVKTVRYYDEIGLITASDVSPKGYRLYSEEAIRKLVFVRHARAFGFNIDVCRELLDLYENPQRSSKEVKEIATERLREIRHKMRELKQLHDALAQLAASCHGDERPHCPIIDYLADDEA